MPGEALLSYNNGKFYSEPDLQIGQQTWKQLLAKQECKQMHLFHQQH